MDGPAIEFIVRSADPMVIRAAISPQFASNMTVDAVNSGARGSFAKAG